VTKLRKDAPGSLTAAKVAAFFRRRRYPRDLRTITAFERGSFVQPTDRFFELYAECVGVPVSAVRRAYARTRQMRERGSGPFATTVSVSQALATR
jgi:hypothetical protein